jgi:hypothetical protein
MQKLSNVSSKYGAPMGRGGSSIDQFLACYDGLTVKVSLAWVRLDSGGYDNGGAYWGTGQALWLASFTDTDGEAVECFFRAPTREAAKTFLPGCKFYR